MRRVWSTIAGLLMLLAAAPPAQAGGALLDFDRDFYLPGDTVHASSGVWLKSAMGRLEDGPYFAYLSPFTGIDRMPPPIGPDGIQVARAEVVPRPVDDTYGDVTLEFVMPEVEPGRYWVTICNDPCKLTLGDVKPSLTTVAADDVDGRISAATDRLRARLHTLRIAIDSRVFGHRADSIRGRLTAVERDVSRLAADVIELKSLARKAEPAPEEERSSALPPLLAFVVPAAVAGVVLGRRSRS